MAFRDRPVFALVPARGGSKGVPRKNLRIVKGKPLVAHSLDAGSESRYVDRVYLSTDDDAILQVGLERGVRAYKRDPAAATDTATAPEVVRDFLGRLDPGELARDPFLVYLQPTSPLRNAAHVDAAFAAMEAQGASMALSVVQLKRTPYKSFLLDAQGRLKSLFEERLSNANRQTLPAAYYPNGAIYIFPVSEFRARGGFPSNGAIPYVMPERESIDIDTEDDLQMMEKL